MALKFPARVRSSTGTAGIGTYTLGSGGTEPTAVGWRNFTQAVADGDLANGDQVGYGVMDLTVTGGPNLIELGLGTWDNTAKTLTRDTVYQPNGSAISWGAGTRDVVVLDLPQVTALLQGAQTIAGVKTFSSVLRAQLGGSPVGVDGTTALVVQNAGAAGDASRLAIISGNTGTAEVSFGDTDAQYRGRIAYQHPTERLDFFTAGTLRAQLDATSFRNAAGRTFDAFESGTRFLLANNSVPSGWSIVASLADKVILTTSTASEIDDQGGSWTISGVTIGSTTLSIAQIPAHTHGIAGHDLGTIVGSYKVEATRSTADGTPISLATLSEGGGNSHTHSFAQDGSWRPSYYRVGVIVKA